MTKYAFLTIVSIFLIFSTNAIAQSALTSKRCVQEDVSKSKKEMNSNKNKNKEIAVPVATTCNNEDDPCVTDKCPKIENHEMNAICREDKNVFCRTITVPIDETKKCDIENVCSKIGRIDCGKQICVGVENMWDIVRCQITGETAQPTPKGWCGDGKFVACGDYSLFCSNYKNSHATVTICGVCVDKGGNPQEPPIVATVAEDVSNALVDVIAE